MKKLPFIFDMLLRIVPLILFVSACAPVAPSGSPNGNLGEVPDISGIYSYQSRSCVNKGQSGTKESLYHGSYINLKIESRHLTYQNYDKPSNCKVENVFVFDNNHKNINATFIHCTVSDSCSEETKLTCENQNLNYIVVDYSYTYSSGKLSISDKDCSVVYLKEVKDTGLLF